MDRQALVDQVKTEYARIADIEGTQGYSAGQFGFQTPESYYEKLLGEVISKIEAGAFDEFANGSEIVSAVANNHARWGISI